MYKRPKQRPLIRTDLSPQEALVEFLDRCGYDGREYAQRLFDNHAHELAEQQRAWLRFQGYDTDCVCESCSACLARDFINLIDPKART
jgi:hypothetical protein